MMLQQWGGRICALVAIGLLLGCAADSRPAPGSTRLARLDELSALWSFYKFHYVDAGRVVSLDEGHITTSEGQGYAMLRAVWSDDREIFAQVWRWTRRNLAVRGDHLLAWKWKGKVLDAHSATDADTDVALALLLAARRFGEPRYEQAALEIVEDIWDQEILAVGNAYYVTAGDWARDQAFPVIHVGYLAPYAYEEFAKLDPARPWSRVATTSYDLLHWLYFEKGVKLPPEIVYVDRKTGGLRLEDPRSGKIADFGYDAFPIFWRVAMDARWSWRWQGQLHERMLAPLRAEFEKNGRIFDRYRRDGTALSRLEALPAYATLHSLADLVDTDFARRLREKKLVGLWEKALVGADTPYYLHNWLWFDSALSIGVTRPFDEFLGFLLPFDFRSFSATFPTFAFCACLLLFPLALVTRGTRWHRLAVAIFLVAAFTVCLRYIAWRGLHSLNFVEPLGPFISLSLWLAEVYCFFSVVLLVVQVGTGGARERRRPEACGFQPSVDVMIPVFREPLEILERTLVAAGALDYPHAAIHVLDDGHRDEVRLLAERCGARYHRGPREHAKAGNLNAALAQTQAELVVVFDTDHVPTKSFLAETVPFFQDPRLGFVQTPHHFRNADIFQHAFRVAGRIPNEQDMFNHGMQSQRDGWGGAFFVGSGAVFRRAALASVGGFKLLSITEDIHTSQHLHAAGWRSVFVNRDLAVGLSAENLSSFIVQRRRWMLGCLQIFFRDNPLFCRGLSLRQRLGYFASLYYFFFPLARLVFWVTPLYYLLFHLHPILSEVSVLSALLLPYLVVLPMISAALIPGWARPLWGSFYENSISAPLARSMFDLLLPKRLGFGVTPKGIVTHERRFDWRSARWTLVLAALTAIAIVKGLAEFFVFGIERDAYFFNLAWAGYNLLFLLAAAMLAWERPQRREEDRVGRGLVARVQLGGAAIELRTGDVSLAGCSLVHTEALELPSEFALELELAGGEVVCLRAALVYQERVARRLRVGVRFVEPSQEARRALLLAVFADPRTWQHAHAREVRGQLAAALSFLLSVGGSLRRLRTRRRRVPRRPRLERLHVWTAAEERSVWLRDASPRGLGLLGFGEPPSGEESWRLSDGKGWQGRGRSVYVRRRLFHWRVGVELVDEPPGARDAGGSGVGRAL